MKFWMSLAFVAPRDAMAMAESAEEAGFHGVALSDHLCFPKDMRSRYPYSEDGSPPYDATTPWPEPFAMISAMSVNTATIRFTTNVYVAPARDVLTVAKGASTAAVLSDNRFVLGVGAGWCEEEFVRTGQDFATRGKRLNEMIPALRALWSGGMVEHDGEHVRFGPTSINPVPSEPLPIWVGGRSPAALRRAAFAGDGWIADTMTPEEAEALIGELQILRKEAGRESEPFEIIVPLKARADGDLYRRMEDVGMTGVLVAPWMSARDDGSGFLLEARIDAIERFGDRVVSNLS